MLHALSWILTLAIATASGGDDLAELEEELQAYLNEAGAAPNEPIHVLAVLEDSQGTMRPHPYLQGRLFFNINEIPLDGIDNDDNGWVDDYVGQYWPRTSSTTPFGNDPYTHPTMVATFAVLNNPRMRILPMEAPNSQSLLRWLSNHTRDKQRQRLHQNPSVLPAQDPDFWNEVFQELLQEFARRFESVITYIDSRGVKVVNMSTAVSRDWVKAYLVLNTYLSVGYLPTMNDLENRTQNLVSVLNDELTRIFRRFPNTIFVASAGNASDDLDRRETLPASSGAENMISVAAANFSRGQAHFSNYGARSVDVAAPGDSIPVGSSGKVIRALGTSYAAPYVAALAVRMRQTFPEITPTDVQEILIRTSDREGDLIGKVRANGIVNPERALAAVRALRKSFDLNSAVSEAWEQNIPRDTGDEGIQFFRRGNLSRDR